MWILIIFGGILILAVIAVGLLRIYIDGFTEIKKPAIYLYPREDSFVNVQLEINGKLTKNIPVYNNGWNVFVTKEGLIDNKYDYLFYEAKLKQIELPNEGWVVKYEDLENWFDINLILLGLNEKEKNQFKDYWLNELSYSNYYKIELFEDSFLKENMDLKISPQPNTLIRLNFNFKALNKKIVISEPMIITPKRIGFTVVEWGGVTEN